MKRQENIKEVKEEFFLDNFLNDTVHSKKENSTEKIIPFKEICQFIKDAFGEEWESSDEILKESKLEREKDAIIGKEYAVNFYREKIKEIIINNNLENCKWPKYYKSLEDGIFHENWGLSGLASWAYDENEKYKASSSAKIIGNRIYCFLDGKLKLQPQRISKERRAQLKKALLLATPKERLEEGFHEVYMHNGIRITIFSGERTKDGQDVMVFRKYVLKTLTFEKMAELGTFPKEAIPFFKSMIKIGYNTLFSGQVRSGKTTFLQTWQKYEENDLEGLAIATDPETPWHKIMPKAPIMQIVADGKDLEGITKSLLRGDNDYVLLEEMRDATAFNIALDITSTGTMRSKATIHSNNPVNVPYKMASKIHAKYGGDFNTIVATIFSNFNYIFEFYQLPQNKSRKRLKSIYELSYDEVKDKCTLYKICHLDSKEGKWKWKSHISIDKINIGSAIPSEVENMKKSLAKLEQENPYMSEYILSPAYYKSKYSEGKLE